MSTSTEDILKAHQELSASFRQGVNSSYKARMHHLGALKRFIQECEPVLCQAIYEDMGRPHLEAIQSELAICLLEVNVAIDNLASWMKPKSLGVPWAFSMDVSKSICQPLGIILIITAWNYPFLLSLNPLVGALAAGNTILIKPSELASASSKALITLLPKYLPKEVLRIIPGAIQETQDLLSLPYGRIFFTGSSSVGKIVLRAAAETMTPTSLELGGKCPVLVGPGANIPVAAKRIVWGKSINGGQACVSPDYIVCHPDLLEELITEIKRSLIDLHGPSRKIQRIANEKHWLRLTSLLDATKGSIWQGGQQDKDSLYLPPTLVTGVEVDDPLMQEEIFGPILPILSSPDWDSAISLVNSFPSPLATYVFASSEGVQRVINETTSGSCIGNDAVIQMGISHFPFGGVGASGNGMYRGQLSFKLFSHEKSVLHRFRGLDWITSFRYPPLSIRSMQGLSLSLSLSLSLTIP
ncbi:MAG: fatty aldehyde dehydrogenase [Piptocephalis tieghemiana]|nr:MAG: fatty aldehyde dehydrogenase [Piptocephalis tieghemiana]